MPDVVAGCARLGVAAFSLSLLAACGGNAGPGEDVGHVEQALTNVADYHLSSDDFSSYFRPQLNFGGCIGWFENGKLMLQPSPELSQALFGDANGAAHVVPIEMPHFRWERPDPSPAYEATPTGAALLPNSLTSLELVGDGLEVSFVISASFRMHNSYVFSTNFDMNVGYVRVTVPISITGGQLAPSSASVRAMATNIECGDYDGCEFNYSALQNVLALNFESAFADATRPIIGLPGQADRLSAGVAASYEFYFARDGSVPLLPTPPELPPETPHPVLDPASLHIPELPLVPPGYFPASELVGTFYRPILPSCSAAPFAVGLLITCKSPTPATLERREANGSYTPITSAVLSAADYQWTDAPGQGIATYHGCILDVVGGRHCGSDFSGKSVSVSAQAPPNGGNPHGGPGSNPIQSTCGRKGLPPCLSDVP